MFSNVLFYLQFGLCIVEFLENNLFHAFMRSVHLTRSVRLYLPSPTISSAIPDLPEQDSDEFEYIMEYFWKTYKKYPHTDKGIRTITTANHHHFWNIYQQEDCLFHLILFWSWEFSK